MYPDLLTFGPLTLKTINVFLVLAFLVSGFVFWRRGKEEHYREDQLFDGFVLSSLVGFVFARMAYCLLNPSDFGFTVLSWLDVFSKPGWVGSVGVIAASLALIRFSRKQKWDFLEISDMWVTAMAAGAGVLSVGRLIASPEITTFQSVAFVAQMSTVLFYGVLYQFLTWLENHYRLFQWYKNGRSVAQTGFVTAVAMIAVGIFSLVTGLLTANNLLFQGISIDVFLYLFCAFGGVVLLLVRSGRLAKKIKRSASS